MAQSRTPPDLLGLVRAASPPFVAGAVSIPLGVLVVAIGAGNLALLNYVHVLSGALWVGMTAFIAFVLGPSMARLSPPARDQVARTLIPRGVFLLPAIVATTLISGPVLAVWRGYWNLQSPTLLLTLALAGVALVVGLRLLLLQLRTYTALLSPSPNADELDQLARQYALAGRVQVAVLLTLVGLMTALRSGLLLV